MALLADQILLPKVSYNSLKRTEKSLVITSIMSWNTIGYVIESLCCFTISRVFLLCRISIKYPYISSNSNNTVYVVIVITKVSIVFDCVWLDLESYRHIYV